MTSRNISKFSKLTIKTVFLGIMVSSCSVPKHMKVREGIDPMNQDKGVAFRNTYYFRTFDACENAKLTISLHSGERNIAIPYKRVVPKIDSLYRFRMTGKVNSLFLQKVKFESGTLKSWEIDPLGSDIVFDKNTGRARFISAEENAESVRRLKAWNNYEKLKNEYLKLKQVQGIDVESEALEIYINYIARVTRIEIDKMKSAADKQRYITVSKNIEKLAKEVLNERATSFQEDLFLSYLSSEGKSAELAQREMLIDTVSKKLHEVFYGQQIYDTVKDAMNKAKPSDTATETERSELYFNSGAAAAFTYLKSDSNNLLRDTLTDLNEFSEFSEEIAKIVGLVNSTDLYSQKSNSLIEDMAKLKAVGKALGDEFWRDYASPTRQNNSLIELKSLLKKKGKNGADLVDFTKISFEQAKSYLKTKAEDIAAFALLGKSLPSVSEKTLQKLEVLMQEQLADSMGRVNYFSNAESYHSTKGLSKGITPRELDCSSLAENRGFQILGPQGWKTFDQDERLIMAMSTSSDPLISSLKEVSQKVLNAHSNANTSGTKVDLLPLVQAELRLTRASHSLQSASSLTDLKEISKMVVDQLEEEGK